MLQVDLRNKETRPMFSFNYIYFCDCWTLCLCWLTLSCKYLVFLWTTFHLKINKIYELNKGIFKLFWLCSYIYTVYSYIWPFQTLKWFWKYGTEIYNSLKTWIIRTTIKSYKTFFMYTLLCGYSKCASGIGCSQCSY